MVRWVFIGLLISDSDGNRSLKMAYPILAETFPQCLDGYSSAKLAEVSTPGYFHIIGSLEFLEFLLHEVAVPVSPGTGFGEHRGGFARIVLCADISHI